MSLEPLKLREFIAWHHESWRQSRLKMNRSESIFSFAGLEFIHLPIYFDRAAQAAFLWMLRVALNPKGHTFHRHIGMIAN
ncbi:hypothetical protein [Variovorax sp. J31P207]|uniref:hypothetical protein n=1 Tax=Variovorax sp. J31P207 TaxID=3053510 RepID=UPI0025790AF1|nr:hypothetical protein [Variovorax sp. J31P207]MDM0071472.1 hypothetical protein [Variovorax sp. J31P207]